MLIGNHDVPPTLLKASSVEIYDTLAVPNVWVANEYELRVIDTKRGSVAVGAAPYPLRSHILDGVKTAGLTIAETDQLLQRELTALLDQLAEAADQQGDDAAPADRAFDRQRRVRGAASAGSCWGVTCR